MVSSQKIGKSFPNLSGITLPFAESIPASLIFFSFLQHLQLSHLLGNWFLYTICISVYELKAFPRPSQHSVQSHHVAREILNPTYLLAFPGGTYPCLKLPCSVIHSPVLLCIPSPLECMLPEKADITCLVYH